MLSFLFSNPTQKEVHLATLRDLMIENQDDQIAKTVLSNSMTLSESVMVPGELDEMMRRTERLLTGMDVWLSVFFGVLVAVQIALGYFIAWPNYVSAFATVFYGCSLWIQTRIQRRYHRSLRDLEELQLELPPTPVSLRKVN